MNAYERQKTKPSLTFNTGYIYPSFLAHTFDVLILESFGGSANHVTVITFHKGKPSVALDRSAVGMQIKRAENERDHCHDNAEDVSSPRREIPNRSRFRIQVPT